MTPGIDTCERDFRDPPAIIREQPRRERFSVDGYVARKLALDLPDGHGGRERHCISVAWPPGARNRDGGACAVSRHIDEAWFRAIASVVAESSPPERRTTAGPIARTTPQSRPPPRKAT